MNQAKHRVCKSGRPTHSSLQTPDVTTEMQIGGAELRDNTAFFPWSSAVPPIPPRKRSSDHHGLCARTGLEAALAGLLLLDLPALEVDGSAEMESTEETHRSCEKVSAPSSLRNKYQRLPESLANLGRPSRCGEWRGCRFLDSDLANGMKNGYHSLRDRRCEHARRSGKIRLAATPLQYGRTGHRSFFRDSNGALHAPTGEERSAAKLIPKWSRTPAKHPGERIRAMIPKICALGRWHSLKICAQLRSLLGPHLCSARLGATIVRFAMPRKASARFLFLCSHFLCSLPFARLPGTKQFHLRPLPVFELHSGFWINLHHTLYHEARLRTAAAAPDKSSKTSGPALHTEPDAKPTLTPAEQREWTMPSPTTFSNYAKGPALFHELIQLKDQLGDFEIAMNSPAGSEKFCDAGLPAKLTQVLEAAAPSTAHTLPDHDRANRRWIMRVAPLVREQAWAVERLATFTRRAGRAKKIRVDVAGYANWTGAYTTADPLRVTISSLDSRNQGAEALEVLFHEGSHVSRACAGRHHPRVPPAR